MRWLWMPCLLQSREYVTHFFFSTVTMNNFYRLSLHLDRIFIWFIEKRNWPFFTFEITTLVVCPLRIERWHCFVCIITQSGDNINIKIIFYNKSWMIKIISFVSLLNVLIHILLTITITFIFKFWIQFKTFLIVINI